MNGQQKLWKGTSVIFHACGPLLLYIVMPGIVMSIGKLIRRYSGTNEAFIEESGNFYTFIGTALVLLVLYKHAKKNGTTVREQATLSFEDTDRKLAVCCILFGMSVSFCLSAVLTLVKIPYLSDSYHEAAGAVYERTDLLLVFLLVGFLSPVIEEIVFRGYMLNHLLEYFRERTSVMICAAVFALCHVNPLWMLYSFLMGVFLGWLAVKKDNTVYAVFVHIGFNLPSVLIAAVQTAGLGSSFFFQNRVLILCYGLIGCAAGRILWLIMKREVGEG